MLSTLKDLALAAVIVGGILELYRFYGAKVLTWLHLTLAQGTAHLAGAKVTPAPVPQPAAGQAPAPLPPPPYIPPPVPITAKDAFKRYADAGGMAAAIANKIPGGFGGYLSLMEMNFLKALSDSDRHKWAADFAACDLPMDDAGKAAFTASHNNLGDIDCTQSALSYFLTLGQYGLTFS